MNAFKKIGLAIFIILFGFQSGAIAQSWFYFEGIITDTDGVTPLVEYPVFVNTNDTTNRMVFTNINGYYIDSVYAIPQIFDYAEVSVGDCYGEIIYHYFDPPEEYNVADFSVCYMPNICEAYFYYIEVPDNLMLINFFDISEGSINKWTWDFGDYNVSNEQNPSHEYAEAGIYQVVLVVEDTNGLCWSAYDEFVTAGEIGDCVADFDYNINPSDDLTVMFNDLSEGNISRWMWDFGDFTFSEEMNPTHTYAEAGVYNICLTVSDSFYYCMDTYCINVVVGDPISCNADFEVSLDTLNNTPNTFIFSDNSTGNISSWFWDFGDGNFSTDQNPVHVYDNGGDYFVCLEISGGGGDFQCWDEKCMEVSTLNYYTFGGHAFIDGFTINVEENDSSNIATAFLYRRFENQWKYMDDREFWKFGYYWFVDKPEGEYLLRVDLKEESVDFGNYAPSYFGGATNWVYAQTFELTNNDQLAVNINLLGLESMAAGVGIISGFLQQGESCTDEITLGRQIVKLFNDESKLIAYTYSNQTGEFEFSSLSNGSYKIQAELTGKLSPLVFAEITSSNPFSDGNLLEIDCQAFVGISETGIASQDFTVKEVFPIPATDYVNLRVQSVSSKNINIELIDQIGRVFSNIPFNLSEGESIIKLELRNMKSGFYVYRITSDNGNILSTGKILINN